MEKILILLIVISLAMTSLSAKRLTIEFLHQNNTGPQNRSRPVLECYPAYQDQFPKCIVASGALTNEDDLPIVFHNDIWRMDIDLDTKTVEWRQLPFENPPIESQGLFHQFWKKNITAISITAGLNFFDPNEFAAICTGDRIVTYDFSNERFELTTPVGGGWGNLSSGACGRYKNDVYCWSGLNCLTFEEESSWTKYNIPTNTLTHLCSENLESMIPRDSPSVTCIEKEKRCLIGSGHLISGGTVDDWNFYDIQDDAFIFFEPRNKPINIQYISPDIAQTWVIKNNNFKIVDQKNILLIGGDNASGILESSDTIRYVGEFNRHSLKFKEFETEDLFTIKQSYLRNIPKIRENEDLDIEYDVNACNFFIEYGGYEHNNQVPFHYPNQVVLYTLC
jgi:hypothetical protein